jgi:tryptophan synthase beta subunit
MIPAGSTVLVTLSGRGDKDVEQVEKILANKFVDAQVEQL